MIIEKNNLDIPDYLNKTFFESTLKNQLSYQNIEIKSLNFTMGSSGGENYCSFIYRVEVVYVHDNSSPKKLHLLVKSIPYDGAREMFKVMNVFPKEKQMYVDILPRIEDYLDNVKIAPKCYYTMTGTIDAMVFEDMNNLGYSVANRFTGLDEEHCKLVLSKLGKYHAASMLLLEKDPSIKKIEDLRKGLFYLGMKDVAFEKSSVINLIHVIKHCTNWSGYEKIQKKLEKIVDSGFVERCQKAIHIDADDIVVINHGDMWVNNFLYKYLDGSETPSDVVLIDFQGSYLGSLGLDINYFLCTSARLDVLVNRKQEIIENGYYASFRAALETGGYKNIPSLNDIKNEIRKKAYYGFFSSIIILPLISMSKADSVNNTVDDFIDEEIAAMQSLIACSSERFKETMKYLLEKFDSAGIFD